MKKIAVKNFFRPFGLHPRSSDLYESDIGWHQPDYDDAMTTEPDGVLRYYLEMGYDFYFFYIKTLRWYWLDNSKPDDIRLSLLHQKEEWDGLYLEDNVQWPKIPSDGDIPDVIFRSDSVESFIHDANIDGVRISEVMNRSWINYS